MLSITVITGHETILWENGKQAHCITVKRAYEPMGRSQSQMICLGGGFDLERSPLPIAVAEQLGRSLLAVSVPRLDDRRDEPKDPELAGKIPIELDPSSSNAGLVNA